MIIGIAGTLGAGKGTVVEYLKTSGFNHYSVSGQLANILDERGVEPVRKNLSALADELAEQYEGGILEVMHEQAQADQATNYILESIHRVSEADYVRSIGGIILGVDAEPRIRFERTKVRQEGSKDVTTFAEFMEAIEREEEGKGSGTPHIRAVIDGADHVVNNNGTVEELHQQINEVLEKTEDAG